MVQEYIRPYELSIWTLQDEFITVLKWSEIENKGQIQNGTVELIDDGTEKLELSVPLYYYDGDRKIKNPLWQDIENKTIIPHLHKIKLIFNKMTEDEAIYEFLITSIDETHENEEITYDIHCEGLAFHELGKIGYKVSLSSDDFLEDWNNWFKNGQVGAQPAQNLQYWNDKIFKYTNSNGEVKSRYNWEYEVQMDWSSFSFSGERDSSIVYEEEYVSSWNTTDTYETLPNQIESFREKWRPINIEESNIYNITQTIAETFGVFCRYKYEYDANYHITARKVIYYNNFIQDSYGHIDLTYPYSSSSITRTIDNSEIISKLYVRPVEDTTSDSNLISIMNVEANRSREDYLLDFDYMLDTHTINEDQYEQVRIYEDRMRIINNELMTLEQKIAYLSNQIITEEANVTLYTNAIQLDNERWSNAKALRDQLTGENQVIEITEGNPEMLILKQDPIHEGMQYVDISLEGVLSTSVALYKTIDYTKIPNSGERLKDRYLNPTFEFDDFGNLTKITNIYISDQTIKRLYMVCSYIPSLYYDNVVKTWEVRRYKDQQSLKDAQKRLDEYKLLLYGLSDASISETNIDDLLATSAVTDNPNSLTDHAVLDKGYGYANTYKGLLKQKQEYIIEFEKMMGPALREGYWQPEEYKDYGHQYLDSFTLDFEEENAIAGSTSLASFVWDRESFEEETTLAYSVGAEENTEYYLLVDLSECLDTVKEHLTDLSFIFYNQNVQTTDEKDLARRSFTIGSYCQFGYVWHNNTYKPVLILTGSSSLTTNQIEFFTTCDEEFKPFLGTIKSEYNSDIHAVNTTITTLVTDLVFINPEEVDTNIKGLHTLSYPRIRINSLLLQNEEDQLLISSNGKTLEMFKDFYVLLRTDTNDVDNSYYITIKPEHLITNGTNDTTISISYTLSNANVSIYLDAREVMKENSRPKVSYTIQLNTLDKKFVKTAYNKLNRIVHINDYELQFSDVNGYISSLSLNLDSPQEDTVEIKNYATKFEDLFTTIVAQTEAMKKNANVIDLASQAINSYTGLLAPQVLQESMLKVDLNYSFNNGQLTIDEQNGIWGTSDSGVVAFRGGGIFTATTKDDNGNWIWNTGILPNGINADLITSGQLDTNKIKIYAGDKVKFQLNGDGLFAYKSLFEEGQITNEIYIKNKTNASDATAANEDIDSSQYVTFNENGLFLIAKAGAYILNRERNNYIIVGENNPNDIKEVKRVEISWEGLKLRNWENTDVFWADADTGNLHLTGTVNADAGYIGTWKIENGSLRGTYMNFINNTAQDSGIFLTPAATTSAQTIQFNGATYYAYVIGNNLDKVYYYNKREDTHAVQSNDDIYSYGTTISSVIPKYTTMQTFYVNGTTGSDASASDDGTYGQTSYTTGTIYTYTKVYVAASSGGEALRYNNQPIEYDGNNYPTAAWYQQLKAAGYNVDTYVTSSYVPTTTLVKTDLAVNTILTLSVDQPKFSVYAATGKVEIDNGNLGNFTLTAGELRNGILRNTTLTNSIITNSSIQIGNNTYATNDYGYLFKDFTPNSGAGQFTLTRVNGGTVTFNIADTTYFRSAVSAASAITLDLRIVGTGENAYARATATTPGFGVVSGYSATKTYSLKSIFQNGEQNGINSVSVSNLTNGVTGKYLMESIASKVLCTITLSNSTGSKTEQKYMNCSNIWASGWNACLKKVKSNKTTVSALTNYSKYNYGKAIALYRYLGTSLSDGSPVYVSVGTHVWYYGGSVNSIDTYNLPSDK